MDTLLLENLDVTGADYSGFGGDDHHFCSVGSRFTDCKFERMRLGNIVPSFGAGMTPSVYVRCSFDGSRLTLRGGPGLARFENCSFRNVTIRSWTGDSVDVVGCVFTGTISSSIFWRSPVPRPPGFWDPRPWKINEFVDNDFSGCKLVGTDFRRGIDLRRQLLPTGPDYVYREDGRQALREAAAIVSTWPDAVRSSADLSLSIWQDGVDAGQEQLFVAKTHLGRASEWLWPALRDALLGETSATPPEPPPPVAKPAPPDVRRLVPSGRAGARPAVDVSALTYVGLPISSGGAHGLGAMPRRVALQRTMAFLHDCVDTERMWFELDRTYTRVHPTPPFSRPDERKLIRQFGQGDRGIVALPASRVPEALRFLDEISPQAEPITGTPIVLRMGAAFRVCDPDTGAPIPGADPDRYGGGEYDRGFPLGTSALLLTLGNLQRLSISFCIPDPTDELIERVVPWLQHHLPFTFSAKQWRLWTQTRTGSFVGRRTTVPLG